MHISLSFVADQDSDMQAACDDEYDTLAEKEELATLASMDQIQNPQIMAQNKCYSPKH